MKSQVDKYVGIPYKIRGKSFKDGLDCYGLIKQFYKENFEVELKLFGALDDQDPFEKNMVEYNDQANFKSMPLDSELKEGDLLTFILIRPNGDSILRMFHVALFLGNDLILHTKEGTGSVIENLNDYSGKKFLNGILRYVNH